MTIWEPDLRPGTPIYAAIVDALASDIEAGRLPTGSQLPPHRKLAEQLGVSIGTITRALNAAERRGLVHGETGRGTFVGGSAVREFGAIGTSDEAVIDLSRTWPLHALDPDLGPSLRAIARSPDRSGLLHYQDNKGMPHHRAAGADWAARFGVETDADSVVVCAGVQHGLTVALAALTSPGDNLLAEALTYPGIKAAAHLLHLKVLGLPMDEEGIVPEAFESACKQRKAKVLYCTPTLHNPTTATMTLARREQIAAIARAHDISIIEDDVHRLLANDPPPTLASLVPERTLFLAGMSKTVTGALRVAYVVAPRELVPQLAERVWATNWMVPPLTAEVAAIWIADGTADATVERKRVEAAKRVDAAKRILGGVRFRSAPHGYHIWLGLPDPWDADRFATEARGRGVMVSTARAFSTREDGAERSIRVSLSAPWDIDSLEMGLERLASVLADSPGIGPAVV